MNTTCLEGHILAMAAQTTQVILHKLLILFSCYIMMLINLFSGILLHVITVVFLCRVSQLSLIVGFAVALSSQNDLCALFEDFLALIAMFR